jgi:hypothetical protein
MAAATAQEEEEEGGRPNWGLTGDSPVRLSWPEDGRRRQIWRQRAWFCGEKSGETAATPGDSLGGEEEGGEAELLSASERQEGSESAALGGSHGGRAR